MPTVHPSAVLDGDVRLADDVRIGPNCVLTGPVTIGAGTSLIGGVYVNGPATLGRDNTLYPFTCVGFAPQHTRYDAKAPGEGVRIGDGNIFREHTTVHRAMTDEGPTTIGSRNYFMTSAHVGHDARVGDECTLVTGTMLGGHVQLADWVTMGGGSGVHQFCRVGRGAMLAGIISITVDLPPFFLASGTNVCAGPNIVGMRRRGLSRDEIEDVRWVFRTLYRSGLSFASAKRRLRERAERPMVAEYVEFLDASQRPICDARPKAARGAGRAASRA